MLSQLYWLKLSQETREKVSQALGIRKSGGVIVNDNQVQSDGRTPIDLAGVSIPQLQEFTGSTMDDFYKLFDLAVRIIEGKEEKVFFDDPIAEKDLSDIKIDDSTTEVNVNEIFQPKKLGRPAKKV